MIDIKLARENPELLKTAVKNKKARVDVDQVLKLDEGRRKLLTDIENLNQEKNLAAKEKNIERGKLVKENLIALEERFKEVDASFQAEALKLPNIPSKFT